MFFQRISSYFKAQPKALYLLLATEVPVFFGTFGIMAIIALYMVESLGLSDPVTFTTFGAYLMLARLTPIVGGYLSDHGLNYRRAILLGGCLMVVGNLILSFEHLTAIYLGLSFFAVGTGFFAPALAASVGLLYKDKHEGRENAFVLYYLCRNLGALLAPTLLGIVGENLGYHVAFIIIAAVIFLGMITFLVGLPAVGDAFGQPESLRTMLSKQLKPLLFAILAAIALVPFCYGVFLFALSLPLIVVGVAAAVIIFVALYLRSEKEQRRHLNYIGLTILVVILFYSINHLCGASFNLFVQRLIDRQVGSVTIPTSVFFSINPLFMILFGVMIMALVNKIKKPNLVTASFTKFSLSLIIFAAGMSAFVAAAFIATTAGQASGWFVVLCYSLLAIAELCMIPIALSLITHYSPTNRTGLMMGLYNVGDALASFLTGKIALTGAITFSLATLEGKQRAAMVYFDLFTQLTLALVIASVVVLALRFVVRRMSLY